MPDGTFRVSPSSNHHLVALCRPNISIWMALACDQATRRIPRPNARDVVESILLRPLVWNLASRKCGSIDTALAPPFCINTAWTADPIYSLVANKHVIQFTPIPSPFPFSAFHSSLALFLSIFLTYTDRHIFPLTLSSNPFQVLRDNEDHSSLGSYHCPGKHLIQPSCAFSNSRRSAGECSLQCSESQ